MAVLYCKRIGLRARLYLRITVTDLHALCRPDAALPEGQREIPDVRGVQRFLHTSASLWSASGIRHQASGVMCWLWLDMVLRQRRDMTGIWRCCRQLLLWYGWLGKDSG